MKTTIAILVLVTSCVVAKAEGPADRTKLADRICLRNLKPDSGKNVPNLSKNEHLASQNAAPASNQSTSDCKQKQEKATGR